MKRAPSKPSHIVGIGASAGGLAALEEFFDHTSNNSGMAFVVIQHLSPDFKSLMDDLLARHTKMTIHRVSDGTVLEANSIYLIPAKSHMTISEGKLFLTEVDTGQHADLPIDVFLNSLAEECGDKSVAVIMSGTGTDGSRGIKAIREAGGLVLAQSLDTAQFDGMPRNALASGFCDLMVSPKVMPEVILDVSKHSREDREDILSSFAEADDDAEFQQVFTLLNKHYNLDFAKYKSNTVGRRIRRRMEFGKIDNQNDYIALLSRDENELNTLYRDLLIGVTEFFRDPKTFEKLDCEIITELFEKRSASEDIRVWSAGCATGEEAYSIAILLAEKVQEYNFKGNITVFATDVHRGSLDFASQGLFSRDRLENVSEERLERFFERVDDNHFQVNPDLRKMIIFAPHNLISDPPFTRMDLVCCRNLLIYLQPEVQEQILAVFHFSLKVDGVLFLGPSESLGKLNAEFETHDGTAKTYRKIRDLKNIGNIKRETLRLHNVLPAGIQPVPQKTFNIDNQLIRDYDVLLKEYMPAGVLIDQNRQILHTFGDTSSFLLPMEGRFENDVLAMVDESLKIPLTTALHRAAKTREQVTTRRLSLEHSGKKKIYDLIVKFIGNHGADSSHFFITLKPVSKQAVSKEHPAEPENLIELDDIPAHLQQRITDLEQELQTSKETLQETIEELQSTNQELQTSNEELMASNEELQSTNEELHSVNEELYTVNAEFEDKNNELKELNQDHVNLLNSLEVGIVFVDKQMRIRKFNPAIERIFNLLPQDIGRPIDHIAYHIDNQKKMLQDFRHVLETGEHREMDVRTEDGQWLLKRILPFRAQDKIEGVLLTFTDINMLKEAEDALRQHAEELEQKVKKRTRSLEIAKEVADAANRAKSAFLANMSHEIRTPMSGVLMATELLAEMDPSPRQADLISTLQKGALNLNTILDDILDFSKIEAGKIDMVKEPLFVKEVVKDIIGFYQPRVTAKNLSVAIEIDPGIPKMLMGDQVRLKQILTNLVSNAVKFTHEGSVEIRVTTVKKTAHNCTLHFAVTDTGIGIKGEHIEVIFEPFAQGDLSLTRKYGGTGLGLAISKRLVELMGGNLWVDTSPEGTTFHFTIVFGLMKQNKNQQDLHVNDASGQAPHAPFSCKVLLAEDDSMNQELISAMIGNIGCDLSMVENGSDAVKTLEKETFDLVLMDISMPVMDGLTATKKIRQFPSDHINHSVPIVALTAHAMTEDIESFINTGMNRVLTKPLSKDVLKDAIRTYCNPTKN